MQKKLYIIKVQVTGVVITWDWFAMQLAKPRCNSTCYECHRATPVAFT